MHSEVVSTYCALVGGNDRFLVGKVGRSESSVRWRADGLVQRVHGWVVFKRTSKAKGCNKRVGRLQNARAREAALDRKRHGMVIGCTSGLQ